MVFDPVSFSLALGGVVVAIAGHIRVSKCGRYCKVEFEHAPGINNANTLAPVKVKSDI